MPPGKIQASAKQIVVNLSEGCVPPGKIQASAKQLVVNLSEGCIRIFGLK